ncbi:MAG: thiamine pyrophosphate-binding protein [Hyphomicrobium sp.]|nr:thiamine pyrophosphate-binding protein [Hyphomicrobium sp.]
MQSGGGALISQLATDGVKHLFMVPGESFLSVLDALHGSSAIRLITCRHESAAAMMAEATGKLTGEPGVAIVTRGPGAANALSGVYIAQQDASPMLLLVGMPPRAMAQRAAFQSIDLTAVFAPLTKWCAIVPSASAVPEFVSRALAIAHSDRPGPVVLGLPEDVLADATDAATRVKLKPAKRALRSAVRRQIEKALADAARPIIIVGGGTWSLAASVALANFADRFDIPIATSFRRQAHIDNRHGSYVGHAGLGMDERLRAGLDIADCVIALGSRLGDVTTNGFSLLTGRDPDQKLIVVSADADAFAATYPHAQRVTACPIETAAMFASLSRPSKLPRWKIWRRDLRQAYIASATPQATPGAVQMERIIVELSNTLPEDAIITNGAGNYAAFLHRYFVYKTFPSQLAPISGSMGYGLPAAIAAKLAHPEKTVIAMAGDGCYQMTSQDLATAVQFAVPLVVIIANNGALGTIRMHQEQAYPGRVIATSLINPDFVAQARAAGAAAWRVTRTADFTEALREALAVSNEQQRPAVIELMLDIEAISPRATITGLRARN